jgi:hypothetical protein
VVALRSRRLETLFGVPLDSLTAAAVRSLVEAEAQEAFDLDFKAAHYGSTEKDKRALAIDVAAMANTAGGVILIGIDEDEQARATAAPGVELNDAERGRISQIIASQVSPFPRFDIKMIPDEGETNPAAASGDTNGRGVPEVHASHGFIMIAVIRSPNAPHAVLVNESLRFPKRNEATTRYLSEPEVAGAYADRAAGAARLKDRITEVEHDAFQRLDRERDPWIVVTLVPDLPGDLAITTTSFNEFRQRTMETGPLIIPAQISLHRVRVGRRRFLADGTAGNSALARWTSLELHTDGAGAYGLMLHDIAPRRLLAQDSNQAMEHLVDDEWIAVAVLSGLTRLAQHARDWTAASGNGVVRATVLPATSAESLEIGDTRRLGMPESHSQVSVRQDLVTAEAVATLDSLALPGPELIAVAAALTNEIGQAFGIAEMAQLRRDGAIRRRYWNLWAHLEPWADRYQIEVSDDRLQT